MTSERNQSDRVRRLSAPLADYAEHLLIGTGLDTASALEIVAGEADAPLELARVAQCLRAGWHLEDNVS